MSKLNPVHRQDCNKYHPIFLLPNNEKKKKKKKKEKLLYNRITKFLNDNNLIYPLQFGF